MDLREYLRIARQRWKIIVGCVAGALLLAVVLTAQMTPQYTSSARLFVSTTQSDSAAAYTGSLFSEQRVTSYADLATGQELARQVIERLNLSMEPGELAGKVVASGVPNTVILEIAVNDANPREAQRLAQAVSEQLTNFVADLETPAGKANPPIKATIVDPASLPEAPSSPNPLRNLGIAGLAGLVLGFGVALFREMFDTSVKSQDEAVTITGAAVMGNIAHDPSAAKSPLVTDLATHAPRAEAFRVLRTNLQFVDVDKSSKVIVVSSSLPEEGKTTTATNLAITLAQAGGKVMLLEGDLRRPKIAENLKLEKAVGLTTVLVGRVALVDAVQDYAPAGDLAVLTSGALPPNPAELLQSDAMSDLLQQARRIYDVIIIDAPPLLPVTDAALLSAQSDGAMIVVRHGKTSRDQLRHAMARLEAVGGRALGVVFNFVPQAEVAGYGSYLHYRNGYPAGSDNSDKETPSRDLARVPAKPTVREP
jgi:capsular exopolysaccharide synthesis family protein